MKKNTLFQASLVLLATLFVACDTSYFDNDIEDFVWNGGFQTPPGYVTYTLSELFEELEVSEIDENGEGVLSFSYTETISGGDESAFDVAIENVVIESSIPTPVTNADVTPFTLPVTLPAPLPAALDGGKNANNQTVYDLNLTQDLTGASFNSGTMVITFTSTFEAADVTLTMNIPSFTKKTDDSEYSGNITLNGDESKQLIIDLDDYNANFTHNGLGFDNTVNHVVLNMSAAFTFLPGEELKAEDMISYEAVLSNASTDVVYGDFKQEGFSVDNNTIALDFFEDFGNGGITFTNASMTIAASNGFGFPIGIDVSGIAGDTGEGTPATILSYTSSDPDELAAGSDIIIIDGIETYGGSSVVTSTTLNKDNSNINALLSAQPTRFNLNVAGSANPVPGGVNENFYATTNDGLSVDVTVEVPLDIEFDDVVIEQDEVEFDLGEDLDLVNSIGLGLTTTNSIPLSGGISIIFLKDGIDLNITKSIGAFDAAPVDANGKSNGNSIKSSNLSFNEAEIEDLKEATHIKLAITFNSPVGKSVKLVGSDAITVKLFANAELEITGEDEDDN